jgi:hypothetical protein
LTFVIDVVGQLSHIREPNLNFAALPGLDLLPLGWGVTTGFVFLGVVRHAVPTRLIGLITLMLAGSSTCALFTYIFIDRADTFRNCCAGGAFVRFPACSAGRWLNAWRLRPRV